MVSMSFQARGVEVRARRSGAHQRILRRGEPEGKLSAFGETVLAFMSFPKDLWS